MSCWDVLERRSRAERDKAAEVVAEVRKRLQDQQTLCDRTQGIAEQYQKKIKATQSSVTYFGDIQLYRTSLRQMQQAVAFIRTQIATLELELKRKQQMLTQTEIERQKYQKLIEREKEQLAKLLADQEARELDEIGGQMHYRRSKLA
jgi:flagellar export protein FliJ